MSATTNVCLAAGVTIRQGLIDRTERGPLGWVSCTVAGTELLLVAGDPAPVEVLAHALIGAAGPDATVPTEDDPDRDRAPLAALMSARVFLTRGSVPVVNQMAVTLDTVTITFYDAPGTALALAIALRTLATTLRTPDGGAL